MEGRVLDITQKQKVSYCIPIWLRDQQIAAAIACTEGRIQPLEDQENLPPVAVCGFAPSLNDTWEEAAKFERIVTASGAHKFMVERGVIPTYHVEVDPRAHKVKLIGDPHPDVEYLIASTCHPAVFEHLNGFNVKLWHVMDSAAEALRVLPRGEWAICGGPDAGLRAMALARFLGFRDIHIFGMDGSDGETGRHAAPHPNQAPSQFPVECGGRTFYSTPALVECARQFPYEVDQLVDATVTVHGDGLIQTLMKEHVRQEPRANALAFTKPPLISAEYREQNAQLHRENLAYGVGGAKHADMVRKLREVTKATSILDYGSGKGLLAKELDFPIWEYDPAIPGKDQDPKPAELVICTDVLEHIEPQMLQNVLSDLKRLVRLVGYFVIHTGPANKTLPDGRNTHLIQKDEHWWRKKLASYFAVNKVLKAGNEITVVVSPKEPTKPAKTIVTTL